MAKSTHQQHQKPPHPHAHALAAAANPVTLKSYMDNLTAEKQQTVAAKAIAAPNPSYIRFVDLTSGEQAARARLWNQLQQLLPNKGNSQADAEILRITALLGGSAGSASTAPVDPLFTALAAALPAAATALQQPFPAGSTFQDSVYNLNTTPDLTKCPTYLAYFSTQDPGTHVPASALAGSEQAMAAVYGMLVTDNHANAADSQFQAFVVAALKEYNTYQQLYQTVFATLVSSTVPAAVTDPSTNSQRFSYAPTELQLNATLWVQVTRSLIATTPAPITTATPPPPFNKCIRFLDLSDGEQNARQELLSLQNQLQTQLASGSTDPTISPQLTSIAAQLSSSVPLDPLFTATATALQSAGSALQQQVATNTLVQEVVYNTNSDPTDANGPYIAYFSSQVPSGSSGGSAPALLPTEQALAAVYGILLVDNHSDPTSYPDQFPSYVVSALGEYARCSQLYQNVYTSLLSMAVPTPVLNSDGGSLFTPTVLEQQISATQWVQVVRTLNQQNVAATDPLLNLKAGTALANQVGTGDNAPPSSLQIDPPDLESQTDQEIVKNNILAMQGLMFASMLEELKLWQVVEKLVELFQNNTTQLGRGPAGDMLYQYWKSSINRMTEMERRNVFARCFGMIGGDPHMSSSVNKDFYDILMRFISAVSSFSRQYTVAQLLQSTRPAAISQEQVRKCGRDLAANCSLHGYGMAWFAATELQNDLNTYIIPILQDSEVRGLYGAKDMWALAEQVARTESIPGAGNSVKYRTMATAGAIILRWIANRAVLLSGNSSLVLNTNVIANPPPRPPGQKPTTNPNDKDLVDACEQFLAVTGTPDQQVDQYSERAESPNEPIAPIRLPQAAQDLLDSAGVSIPGAAAASAYGINNGNGNGKRRQPAAAGRW